MTVHASTLIIVALLVFALAYRFYAKFIITKALVFNKANPTPAHNLRDGKDYHPTNRYVLFGHHFAAISGAGPLVGPVLAAQFGFLPGYLWILIGAVLGGAVHDMVILFASVRMKGLSLIHLAKEHVSPTAAVATAFVAGIENIFSNYLPKHTFQGNMNAGLTVVMLILVVVIFFESARRCIKYLTVPQAIPEFAADPEGEIEQ